VERKLDAAEAALKRRDLAEARAHLQAVNLKDAALAPDDVPVLEKRKAALENQLGR
jgi:hypothetical protein